MTMPSTLISFFGGNTEKNNFIAKKPIIDQNIRYTIIIKTKAHLLLSWIIA